MSKCKSCGAEIIWIKTKSGKAMPCNPQKISYRTAPPFPDVDQLCGNGQVLTLITPDGRVARGTFDPASEKIGYVSHFATCPAADSFRRR